MFLLISVFSDLFFLPEAVSSPLQVRDKQGAMGRRGGEDGAASVESNY